VQVNNDGAISFYEKFDFEVVERKENYYKKIEPADAFVLQKTLKSTDRNDNEQELVQTNGN
jgi:ribosomal protein S18 acetylase RimI-like enzyme